MGILSRAVQTKQRMERRHPKLCEMGEIGAGGLMGGAAFYLCAISDLEGHHFCSAAFSIFIASVATFNFLLEELLRYGPFSIVLGFLLVVLTLVLSVGSPPKIIHWVPMIIAVWSFLSIALSRMTYRASDYGGGSYPSSGLESSLPSFRPSTLAQDRSDLPGLARIWDNFFFYMPGPSSHYSPPSSMGESDMSLSNLGALSQSPSSWEPHARAMFPWSQVNGNSQEQRLLPQEEIRRHNVGQSTSSTRTINSNTLLLGHYA